MKKIIQWIIFPSTLCVFRLFRKISFAYENERIPNCHVRDASAVKWKIYQAKVGVTIFLLIATVSYGPRKRGGETDSTFVKQSWGSEPDFYNVPVVFAQQARASLLSRICIFFYGSTRDNPATIESHVFWVSWRIPNSTSNANRSVADHSNDNNRGAIYSTENSSLFPSAFLGNPRAESFFNTAC